MDPLQLLIGGISNGCIYGVVALGFVLIYKATEAINFAQGDLMMIGAFITLTMVNQDWLGLPFVPGVLIAILIMAIFCYALEVVVIRRLFGQPQFSVVVLTIALGFVLRFFAGLIWGHAPQSLETPMAGKSLQFGNLIVGVDELLVIAATLVLTVVLYVFFSRTRIGVAMQASSQNQLAALYMGIPVKQVSSLIWGLAGITATIAGVLFAAKGAIDPSSGLLGIKAFAAAVIGGFGSLPGALLGGLIIGIAEPLAQYYAPTGISQIAPYAIMLLVLVIRPKGILAQVAEKKV